MKKVVIAKSILDMVEKDGTLFGRGGLKVHATETSEEMLDLHRRIKADLIIIDYSQPVMNGARLCSAIRTDPGIKDVSLILACEDGGAIETACWDAGANAVIAKPVDPFSLFSKVAELIIIPQRKDMRVLLSVSIEGKDGERPFFATSYNISVSGMLLETARELQVADVLKCTFRIAHSEITTACTVVRRDRAESGRFRYGVQFLNVAARNIVIIEQYVKSSMKQ